MGIETLQAFRVQPNEHVDYMKAVPITEVTFKEPVLDLHAADENGLLSVLEEAVAIPTEQLLADLKDAEICIVEIDGEKVGYFVGTEQSGFYLGPEVDLEFLKENKPEVFEEIKTEGSGLLIAQQNQLQPTAAPSVPGGGGGGAQQAIQNPMQVGQADDIFAGNTQMGGGLQGQSISSHAPIDNAAQSTPGATSTGDGQLSIEELMALVKAKRAADNKDQ